MVAGVFVRVFNEQPAFPLADPAGFCKGLVTYVHAATRAEAQQQQQQQQQEHQGRDAGEGSNVATPEQQQQVGDVTSAALQCVGLGLSQAPHSDS